VAVSWLVCQSVIKVAYVPDLLKVKCKRHKLLRSYYLKANPLCKSFKLEIPALQQLPLVPV